MELLSLGYPNAFLGKNKDSYQTVSSFAGFYVEREIPKLLLYIVGF